MLGFAFLLLFLMVFFLVGCFVVNSSDDVSELFLLVTWKMFGDLVLAFKSLLVSIAFELLEASFEIFVLLDGGSSEHSRLLLGMLNRFSKSVGSLKGRL